MRVELTDAFSLVVPCDSRAPATVRRELDKLERIDAVRGNANLVATEMVSNAVRHSGGTPQDQIEIHAWLSPNVLEISVHDPGLSDRQPEIRTDRDELDVGGLGLLLVDRLSDRWGTGRPGGHTVWAQFRI